MRLPDEQRKTFLRKDPRGNFAEYGKAVDNIIDDRLRTSMAVRGTEWIEPLVSMADALSGLHPPTGLILGGVICALSVTKRWLKFQEVLVQFLTKAMASLGQLKKFRTNFLDSTEIQKGLVDVFDIILQVCSQACNLFHDHEGEERKSSPISRRSFDKDYGELKNSLDARLESFDRTVQTFYVKELENLHGGQTMALRMQLETYEAIRRNEGKQAQEERARQAWQLQQEQGM